MYVKWGGARMAAQGLRESHMRVQMPHVHTRLFLNEPPDVGDWPSLQEASLCCLEGTRGTFLQGTATLITFWFPQSCTGTHSHRCTQASSRSSRPGSPRSAC